MTGLDRATTYRRAGTACPRCSGSMFPERVDAETRERLRCLSCGHLEPLPEIWYIEDGRERRRHPQHGKIRL